MKKLISIILLITLTLALSGCGKSDEELECNNKDGYYWSGGFANGCYEYDNHFEERMIILKSTLDNDIYYTQEEVDILIAEARGISATNDLYVLALIADDFYTKDELDEGFEDILIHLQELEEQDTNLETNISYSTISLIDILLFMYNEEVESGTIFTDEDIIYYEMLVTMREMYVSELENGGE